MKSIKCPACGSASIQNRGKRYALYPSGIVVIVGLLFALLHQLSTPYEFHCDGCQTDFMHRTTIARIARVFLYVLGIASVLLVLLVIVVGAFSNRP